MGSHRVETDSTLRSWGGRGLLAAAAFAVVAGGPAAGMAMAGEMPADADTSASQDSDHAKGGWDHDGERGGHEGHGQQKGDQGGEDEDGEGGGLPIVGDLLGGAGGLG